MSGVYDVAVQGGGERGEAVYFNNPMDYVGEPPRRPPRLAARGRPRSCSSAARGSGRTRPARSTRRSASARCSPRRAFRHEVDLWGHDVPHDWPSWRRQLAHHLPRFVSMTDHVIGLLLGTEEDWPAAFEALVVAARAGRRARRCAPSGSSTSRSTCATGPRYSLVIDRLAWWYDLPRAWLKKVSLMDDVYLLNNPFTFQAMEKHSAYCALMRLGIRVPETWLIPHKVPPREPALPADRRALQRAVRPRGDRRRHRLPALHEAVRRRPVGRRVARRLAGGAARALRRVGRADDAPADGARGLRRLRALALDRRRDDVDVVRPVASRCTTGTRCATTSSRRSSATR